MSEWWFVLRHPAAGDGGTPSCSQDGRLWTLSMPVMEGLIAEPSTLVCVECGCRPMTVFSGPTPPSTEAQLRRADGASGV